MPFALDHIVIAVADLDAAIRDYAVLGFTVLPGGEHPRGSRNALVCFDDGAYLEIIAFARPVPGFRWQQVLERAGPGLVDYALLPDSLDVRLEQARRRGLVIDGPIDGARLRPDGEQLLWRSARPPEPDIPFLCEDVTARVLRVPDGPARRHANGVTGVAEVTVAVADRATSAARYRALLGLPDQPTAPQTRFGLPGFTMTLRDDGSDRWIADHLARRGQGACAVAFHGPAGVVFDARLTHGVRLERAVDAPGSRPAEL